MNGLGFVTLIIYIFMLIGVEKYRMYVLPFAGIALVLVYLKEKKIEVGSWKILITYLVILVTGYIFNLFSPSGATGGEYFLVINTIFLFAFIFMNFIKSSRELSTVIWTIILAGGILGILCIKEYLEMYLRLSRNPDLLIYYRAGAFEKYFYTGVFLMVSGTITISKLYIESTKWDTLRDKIKLILGIVLGSLIFQGLLLTKTRSAIYTFILGSFLIVCYKPKIKKALVLFLALISIYTLNPNHVKSYSETVTIKSEEQGLRQESDNLRRVMWKGAIEVWRKAPITGVGYDIDVVKKSMNQYSREVEDSEGNIGYGIKGEAFRKRFTESHSMYLNFLMQGGIIIILFLFLFVYTIPEQFIKNYRNIRELKLLHKMGCQKIDDTGRICFRDIEMYESINVGAMMSIVNLLVVGIAWDIWGWAFQVQEIFQLMLMLLLVIELRISSVYKEIREEKKRKEHDKSREKSQEQCDIRNHE